MFTTLDHLEQHIEQQSTWSTFSRVWKEIRGFSIFFLIVFIISNVVVNAQLYQNAVVDFFDSLNGSNETVTLLQAPLSPLSHNSWSEEAKANMDLMRKKQEMENIITSVNSLSPTTQDDFVAIDNIQSALQENLSSYNLWFNTLPPTDRIIIPKIKVNAPMIQSSFNKHIDQITKEDFDKDLYNGVVQYPTTPMPGMWGNTLLFWHTSYESWKKNPYATIFSQITKLVNGDSMQLVQNGKLYEYEVVARAIVDPNKVNEEYLKYKDGNYLTLLWCYPIWSDKQRILIIGKLKAVN